MRFPEERLYYLAFSTFEEGIGPMRFQALLNYFSQAKKAWEAKREDLEKAGLGLGIINKFIAYRSRFDLNSYIECLIAKNIGFLTLNDPDYPPLLKEISDAPFVLYYKGVINSQKWWLDEKKIAVVGTRKATSYGRSVTEDFTLDLVKEGFCVVSGMARGIDTIAHKECLKNHGHTIAVLGCGVDVIYPPENGTLYTNIINNGGAVVSEMPLSRWAGKGTFPARNRIISGLSQGVLMTEGAIDSGALITCSYAAAQGREVFSVPGGINSYLSEGTLSLIKKGAHMVTDISDIWEELGVNAKSKSQKSKMKNIADLAGNLNSDEIVLAKLLQGGDLTVDDMIKKSGLSASKAGCVLSLMELKGYIKKRGGKYSLDRR